MDWPYELGAPPETLARCFDIVVRQFEKPMLRLLLGYSRREAVAAELAQEVFVKAYQQIFRYDPTRPFSGWIFTIAANHARDFLRRQQSHPQDSPLENTRDCPDAAFRTPDRQMESAELSVALEAAITGLDPVYSEPLILRHSAGLDVREIGEVLGLSVDAVKTRLSRARRQLQMVLEKEWSPK